MQQTAARERARLETSATGTKANGWATGALRYKLQPHQEPVFDRIMQWIAEPPDSVELGALYDSVFVLDIARRWGKTTLCLIILYIWAITLPKRIGRGAILTYATREKDQIKRIVLPIHRMLTADAPFALAPKHYGSHEGMGEGLYFPAGAGGSVIKLVGVDKDPHRLRGEGSDGGVFSEAGHMKDLHSNVTSVFLPQFQQRPWARLILESTGPNELDHDYDVEFVPDAKLRDAYVFATIDDNTTLSEDEKAKALREAGGKDSPGAQLEYYGIRRRDPIAIAVPEYNPSRHIGTVETPPYAIGCVFQDPGHRDLFAVVWGYWHFELQMLVIQRSWAKRNAGTGEVAEVIAATNAELWEQPGAELRWWDGPIEKRNPGCHISDTDPRLIHDMRTDHGMVVHAADKSVRNHGVGEAKFYKLRNALREVVEEDGQVARPRIIIEPDSGPLADHLQHARWNATRTDLQRTPKYGHADCLLATVYGWAAVQRWRNVNPNRPVTAVRSQDLVIGPNYVAPLSKADKFRAAITGKGVPGAGVRRRPTRCPVCSKVKACTVWTNGQLTCSEACRDKWLYRNTGGVAPPMPAIATGTDDEQKW